jgi:hypothetical protein
MRIIINVLTNKNDACLAVDFIRIWPFVTYEVLEYGEDGSTGRYKTVSPQQRVGKAYVEDTTFRERA